MAHKDITWECRGGELIRLFCGRPESSWPIHSAPRADMISALSWDDWNGEFDNMKDADLRVFLCAWSDESDNN